MLASDTRPLYPEERTQIPTERGVVWAPQPVWTLWQTETICPARIRTLVVQSVAQLLHWLSVKDETSKREIRRQTICDAVQFSRTKFLLSVGETYLWAKEQQWLTSTNLILVLNIDYIYRSVFNPLKAKLV